MSAGISASSKIAITDITGSAKYEVREMKNFCDSQVTENTRKIAKNIFSKYMDIGFFSSTFNLSYDQTVLITNNYNMELIIGKKTPSPIKVEIGFGKNIMLRIKSAFGIDITKDIQEITRNAMIKMDTDTIRFASKTLDTFIENLEPIDYIHFSAFMGH
jgi:hypothetical protein